MSEPNWQLDKDGYMTAHCDLWGLKGKMKEHRWIMSHHLQRWLEPGEIVHHINGNRTDNRIENLELRTSTHPPGQSVREMCDFCIEYLAAHIEDLRRLGHTR